jgi:hypothetical protein
VTFKIGDIVNVRCNSIAINGAVVTYIVEPQQGGGRDAIQVTAPNGNKTAVYSRYLTLADNDKEWEFDL